MSELGGGQWEARMSGPANLNVPRRKKTGSVKEGVGELSPESVGSDLRRRDAWATRDTSDGNRRKVSFGPRWRRPRGLGAESSYARAGLPPPQARASARLARAGTSRRALPLHQKYSRSRPLCPPSGTHVGPAQVHRSFERCTRLRGSYLSSSVRWNWDFLCARPGKLGRPHAPLHTSCQSGLHSFVRQGSRVWGRCNLVYEAPSKHCRERNRKRVKENQVCVLPGRSIFFLKLWTVELLTWHLKDRVRELKIVYWTYWFCVSREMLYPIFLLAMSNIRWALTWTQFQVGTNSFKPHNNLMRQIIILLTICILWNRGTE